MENVFLDWHSSVPVNNEPGPPKIAPGETEGKHNLSQPPELVHTNIIDNFHWANKSPEWSGENPYGNGNASKKIIDSLE